MTFRYLTPPKYANELDSKNRRKVMFQFLEDRLNHFCKWLQDRQIEVYTKDGTLVTPRMWVNLVEEYVNG